MKTLLVILAAALTLTAGARHDPAKQTWTLKSGPVEYRLRLDGKAVRLDYFGPSGLAAWRMGPQRRTAPLPSYDIAGTVEGQTISPDELELLSHEISQVKPAVEGLRMIWRHQRLPLEIEGRYAAWGETGVITRHLTISNKGNSILTVESLPQLAMRLPPGDYELTYLWGGWGQEKQVATEKLSAGRRTIASSRGRSTSLYSPWFSLRNRTLGVQYAAKLASVRK
jgi:hypothetical protein